MSWFEAFILTQLFEISVGLCIWREGPRSRRILGIFYASALTHLCVWFLFYPLYLQKHYSYEVFLLCAECYAYGVEIIWYKLIKAKSPILLSCAANSTSFVAGLIIHALFLS